MASIGRDGSHLSLPGLKADERSETAESIYKSERPSSIPLASGRVGNATSTFTRSMPPPLPNQQPKPGVTHVHHRFLSPAEWARVAHGIGAIREGETHSVVHPNCWYWPTKGLPDGLYRDVIAQRFKYFATYHLLSTLRWILMILQIVLGAVLTALGSLDMSNGTSITVLAAINTVDAGLLALMHNSGLPDRYRLNRVEFVKVEDFLKELLDTGIVESGQTVDDILSDCFSRFQSAKATVLANMPDSYTIHPSHTPSKGSNQVLCPDPAVHFMPGHP
ncbi:hypothetical protein B0T25DRAFT_590977 [Lasiosphaeria hispida]|uniref:SMODS and SLOG-associating 2TM effector domain-containing protein n=1 Tax=Lasiosphaeria hispida TaxID=260671 RepID=A0AAJ0HIN8_9PEZI|nr:hypothetical protein B0T25DRAFT_590977 [Lasiosphaeria hispida]